MHHVPRRVLALLLAACTAWLGGCATRAVEVAPKPDDPAAYAGWSCERLADAADATQQRAADVAYQVDARAGNNMIALGLGIAVFWPALMAVRPDGPEAIELAELKGRFEALRAAALARPCGPVQQAMAAQRAAALPVTVGERLVYEERQGSSSRQVGLRLAALRRDRLDFQLDIDGRVQDTPWRQDLSGNPLPLPGPLVGWRRLLRPDLELGQVLYGDLAGAGELRASGRVRGQVVATGPQRLDGHSFDVAVIEQIGRAHV
jgi:hypothetical protein